MGSIMGHQRNQGWGSGLEMSWFRREQNRRGWEPDPRRNRQLLVLLVLSDCSAGSRLFLHQWTGRLFLPCLSLRAKKPSQKHPPRLPLKGQGNGALVTRWQHQESLSQVARGVDVRTKLGYTSKEGKDVTAGRQIATSCSAFRGKPKGKKVAQYPSGQLLLLRLLPL